MAGNAGTGIGRVINFNRYRKLVEIAKCSTGIALVSNMKATKPATKIAPVKTAKKQISHNQSGETSLNYQPG